MSITQVSSRTALAALTPSVGDCAYLTESGREGVFIWSAADQSTQIVLDPLQGVYVAPASDSTGGSGAWIRPFWHDPVDDYMFGAIDGADNGAVWTAMSKVVWNIPCAKGVFRALSKISTAVDLGAYLSTGVTSSLTPNLCFAAIIKATAQMDYMVKLQNVTRRTICFDGCEVWGQDSTDISGSAISGRLAMHGFVFDTSSHAVCSGELVAYDLLGHAMTTVPGTLNHFVTMPSIRATALGSSPRASTGTKTGTLANGSAVVTNITSTTGMVVGATVSGIGIPAGTRVLSIDSSTQITLTQNATASGQQTLTFSPVNSTYVMVSNWTAFTSTQNGTLVDGSPIVSGLTSTVGMISGYGVTGTGIPTNTGILSVDSPTQITLDHNATASATNLLTIQSRKGIGNSNDQRTLLTLDVAPRADIYGNQRCLKINGFYYRVDAITGTGPYYVSLDCPWVDSVTMAEGSGIAEWVFGGPGANSSNSAGTIIWPKVLPLRCGFAALDGGPYGGIWHCIGAGTPDTEIWFGYGDASNSVVLGCTVIGGYSENDPIVLSMLDPVSGAGQSYGISFGTCDGHALDPGNFYRLAPRAGLTNDGINGRLMFEIDRLAGYESEIVAQTEGNVFTAMWDPPSLAAGAGATTSLTIPYISDTTLLCRARFSNSLQGLTLTAQMTANSPTASTSTVTVTLFNGTGGGPVDLGSGTISVTVLK